MENFKNEIKEGTIKQTPSESIDFKNDENYLIEEDRLNDLKQLIENRLNDLNSHFNRK